MKEQKKLDNLNYREAQKRNSQHFKNLQKKEQKLLKEKGYRNVGWNNVINSWQLLQTKNNYKPIDFVDFAIQKAEENYQKAKEEDDLMEVLNAGKKVISALKMKYQ
ncbi:hypothetical protein Cyast_0532 [Cyanobacterium stanieri PCC 7202]|uniref:Uncharacterized protein n=1 Tax=Cyanobacterium stanieri (strain ATCC 29140 / PCC 7202) TaxID=292563 RepID=K9YHR7_CYASC|nr:hypothetical protein Cyast_0532 [Cyanobacterium stanieri PCC 7202]